jgi:hypothetical protein
MMQAGVSSIREPVRALLRLWAGGRNHRWFDGTSEPAVPQEVGPVASLAQLAAHGRGAAQEKADSRLAHRVSEGGTRLPYMPASQGAAL